jgi:Fe-S cluster biogenesis protein NfuA
MNQQKTIHQQVDAALDGLRPYLANDGGNVEIVEITKEGIVKVKLLGACSTCPQSYMTMKAGIEDTVKKSVPGITAVQAV